MKNTSLVVGTLLLTLIACQPANEPAVEARQSASAAIDRERVQVWLTELTDQVIIPRYRKLHMSGQQMLRRTEQFCLNSTDDYNLQSTRRAWVQLLSEWHHTEAFLFGPAVENDRDLHIYYRFPKAKVIKRLLSKTELITLDDIDEAGIGAQGIATLEYLLFSYEQDSSEVTSTYTNPVAGELRCSLLVMVAKDLETRLDDLYQDWTKGENNFRDALLDAGEDNTHFTSQQEVLDQVLSKLYQSVETSAQRRRNDEPFRSGMGFVSAHATLELAQRVFENGLQDLLIDSGHIELANKFETQFTIINSISVPNDIFNRRTGYPYFEEIDQYFNAALTVANLIRNDLAAALNLQLTLFDADGDF